MQILGRTGIALAKAVSGRDVSGDRALAIWQRRTVNNDGGETIMMGSKTLLLVIAAQLVAMSGLARGEEVETFAKVHTINLYVGYTPGGSYDFYARLFARHVGKHLPGNPTVVVQNMPGAGGLAAANYLYAVAPRDGTALGMLSQTVAIDEALAAPGIRYKSAELNWIGRMTATIEVTMTWHNSKVKTIEDARTQEVVLASTGPGS